MTRPTDRAGELVAGRAAAVELLAGAARGACVCTGACLCDPQPHRCRAVSGELRCEFTVHHAGAHGAWTVQERGIYNFAVRAFWPSGAPGATPCAVRAFWPSGAPGATP